MDMTIRSPQKQTHGSLRRVSAKHFRLHQVLRRPLRKKLLLMLQIGVGAEAASNTTSVTSRNEHESSEGRVWKKEGTERELVRIHDGHIKSQAFIFYLTWAAAAAAAAEKDGAEEKKTAGGERRKEEKEREGEITGERTSRKEMREEVEWDEQRARDGGRRRREALGL